MQDNKVLNIVGIQLKRYPYEEPDLLNLVVSVCKGDFAGCLEFYCDTNDLRNIGEALQSFPKKVPDEYVYEIGSNKPEVNFAFYFMICAYTLDKSGHCALQIVIDNNEKRPDEEACRFSIKADPAAIQRLGRLFLAFSQLKHHTMIWSLSGEHDCLVECEEQISR